MIIAGLIPIAPKMMNLRIWILERLHLFWFAKIHRKYYDGFVIALRIILACIAVILLGLGIQAL